MHLIKDSKEFEPITTPQGLIGLDGKCKYFASIDICSGYWQCCIAKKDILKTTFLMRYGIYKWIVMPMGLTNAPATFMQTMNNLFSDMLDSSMVVFLDDILAYSCMVDGHYTYWKKYLHAYGSIHSTVSLRSVASYTAVQCSLALMLCLKPCI